MKYHRFPALAVASTLALLSALGCSDLAGLTGTPAFDCAHPPAQRTQVSPKDLVSAFGDNLVAAEQKWGNDQVLELMGEASRVSRDDDGAFIALRGGPLGKGKIHAYFPDANASAFAKVEEGQQVTVLAQLKIGRSNEKRIVLQSACLVTQ